MGKAENWVHYTQNILNINRLTHLEPEVPEGVDTTPEDLLKLVTAKDPYEPRLKPISEDAKVKGGLPAWNVRLCGEIQNFGSENPILGLQNYGVAVAKSLVWPGAYSFFNSGRVISIYVGDGQKYETKTYYPIFPPTFRTDPKDKPT